MILVEAVRLIRELVPQERIIDNTVNNKFEIALHREITFEWQLFEPGITKL